MTENHYLQGIPASPGIVIGRALVLSEMGEVKGSFRFLFTEEEQAAEIGRLQAAMDQAHEDLTRLHKDISRESPEHAHLIELHLLILKDQMLCDEPLRLIREERLNAEWALYRSFEKIKDLFRRIEDPYIKGRLADVESVYRRLVGNLTGKTASRLFDTLEPVIIVAHDLSPAETTQMANSKVVGFVTERGGKTSHTAIMAQAL